MIANSNNSERSVDSFFDDMEPKSTEFTVTISGRHVFGFRVTADTADLYGINNVARDLIEIVQDGKYPDSWKPFATSDRRTLAYVANLAARHISRHEIIDGEHVEAVPFTQFDFLRMAKVTPHAFDALRAQVDNFLAVETETALVAAVKAQKKD